MDPCQQLAWRERLDDIVVRRGQQPSDDELLIVALGQDHQWREGVELAHLLANTHSVVPLQGDLHDHHVDQLGLKQIQRLVGFRRRVDLMAFLLQQEAEQL